MREKEDREGGVALPMTLFALVLFSVLGLFMSLDAVTGVRISDNFESHAKATYAALAGLDHAAALLGGLDIDAVLRGPDGAWDGSPASVAAARTARARMPLPPLTAQALDLAAPETATAALPDDGVLSTGAFAGAAGLPLIPVSGLPLSAAGAEPERVLGRYFVKVTDNNGNPSELGADPGDDPFTDGDGIVIVRSLGVARTFTEFTGALVRRNSVAVFETRLRRERLWDPGPALTVIGSAVDALFAGDPVIEGLGAPGIGAVDTDAGDGVDPAHLLRTAAGAAGTVAGGGLETPSVGDITASIASDRDRGRLLDPRALEDFIQVRAPRMADLVLDGPQTWSGGAAPDLGVYNSAEPWNAPGQAPRITLVRGDLSAPEGLSGGGILVVTGALDCSGPIAWAGLVLVLGEGRVDLSGPGSGIEGGFIVANLTPTAAGVVFGTPWVAIGGKTRIAAHPAAVRMALSLFPLTRVGFREITTADP
ncbi:MAG: hypothetical protein JXP48_06455 [Acidobacteria bacterium]|nr:hypothetical protein [Acidobacteriota bacterium]